jgi:hypothetical protein
MKRECFMCMGKLLKFCAILCIICKRKNFEFIFKGMCEHGKFKTVPVLNSGLQKKNGNFHIKSHEREKIRKPSWRHFSCRFVFNLSILINLRNKFNSFVSNISAKKLSAVTTSIDHSKHFEMSPI